MFMIVGLVFILSSKNRISLYFPRSPYSPTHIYHVDVSVYPQTKRAEKCLSVSAPGPFETIGTDTVTAYTCTKYSLALLKIHQYSHAAMYIPINEHSLTFILPGSPIIGQDCFYKRYLAKIAADQNHNMVKFSIFNMIYKN